MLLCDPKPSVRHFVAESSQSSEQESDHSVVGGHDDEKLSNIFHTGDSAPAMGENDVGNRRPVIFRGVRRPGANRGGNRGDKITSSTAQAGARDVIQDQGPATKEHVACEENVPSAKDVEPTDKAVLEAEVYMLKINVFERSLRQVA
ncbi:hypothetical protein PInf_005185 [Phytophthora infestans]|nr:hypothetical protein PInf_005185 [Phytophthora infestans]